MTRRGLTAPQAAAVRRELATRAGRSRVRELGAQGAAAREAWTWGRQLGRPELAELAAPPARIAVICTIERTYYRAAKGKNAPRDTWVHQHDRPYALLARAARPGERTRRSTDAIRPSGPEIYQLGEALGFEGRDLEGRPVEVTFPPRAVQLVAEPRTARMMLAGVPLWICRNGSRCTATDRGLIR
jgi:hypothetical protein